MRSIRWPLTLLALCVLGCGALTTHRVMTGAAGPPHQGDVLVVMLGQPPPPGLQEVGIVQAVGSGTYASLEHVIGGLKQEAALLGCTVLVSVKIDQGSATASGTGVCMRPPGPGLTIAPVASAGSPPPPSTTKAPGTFQ